MPGYTPESPETEKINAFMKKHFSFHDTGISPSILAQILQDGERKTEEAKQSSTERDHQKYDQLKAGTEDVTTNNIWNLFNPLTKNSLEKLLEKLRQTEHDPETQQRIIDQYFFWEKPLYALVKNGTLQKAISVIGVQEAEAYLEIMSIFMKIRKDIISRNPNPYKISKEDLENLKVQHDIFLKKLYITLYDLGVDVARLDV